MSLFGLDHSSSYTTHCDGQDGTIRPYFCINTVAGLFSCCSIILMPVLFGLVGQHMMMDCGSPSITLGSGQSVLHTVIQKRLAVIFNCWLSRSVLTLLSNAMSLQLGGKKVIKM